MTKKIINIITTLILIVLLAAVSVFVAPKVFGITPMVVLSGSMEPTYPVGSLIYVEKVDAQDLAIDDNVTFYLGNSETVVTHRVVENNTEKHELITKGDANKSIDGSPILYSNVIGKAKDFVLPGLGYIGVFMTSTSGYIMIGILLATSFILSFMNGSKKKKGVPTNEDK